MRLNQTCPFCGFQHQAVPNDFAEQYCRSAGGGDTARVRCCPICTPGVDCSERGESFCAADANLLVASSDEVTFDEAAAECASMLKGPSVEWQSPLSQS